MLHFLLSFTCTSQNFSYFKKFSVTSTFEIEIITDDYIPVGSNQWWVDNLSVFRSGGWKAKVSAWLGVKINYLPYPEIQTINVCRVCHTNLFFLSGISSSMYYVYKKVWMCLPIIWWCSWILLPANRLPKCNRYLVRWYANEMFFNL